MQFLYSPLTWAFFLVLAPLIIHLINMMRHRRIKWAAMDFLLQSYKKHRKWVWLKQLMLLLARMAAIAAVVAMLAQLITSDQWAKLFSGRTTHHVVLLDDSYSMSDTAGGASAFDRAQQAVRQIGMRASGQDTEQRITVIRFSRAQRGTAVAAGGNEAADGAGDGAGDETADPSANDPGAAPPNIALADLSGEIIDSSFDALWEERRRGMQVTELAVGPGPALEFASQLIGERIDENRIVYVVSDFRRRDWENPKQWAESLERLEKAGASLHLVSCVQEHRPNLGIVGLEPESETRAAGVPLFVNVRVKNFGAAPVENVEVRFRTLTYDPLLEADSSPEQIQPRVDELRSVSIERIEAGETAVGRIQVAFAASGRHVVEASLPDDAVAADNQRRCVVDFGEGEPVLVVDGDPQQRNEYYLTSAFVPRSTGDDARPSRANTGILPNVQPPAFLRDLELEELQRYRAVYLLDVPTVDAATVDKLEAYVRDGGGLAVFLGPQVSAASYNGEFHRDGRGLLPAKLGLPQPLPPKGVDDTSADFEVEKHPIFDVFQGDNNSYLRQLQVSQFYGLEPGWEPPAESSTAVIATLRGGWPLMMEKPFGQGRVLLVLTTLAPTWNDWAHELSFVVLALKTHSHLAAARRETPEKPVGSPIELQLEAAKYRPEVTFVAPGRGETSRLLVNRTARGTSPDSPLMETAIGAGVEGNAAVGETDRSGVYEIWPRTLETDRAEVRRIALNVEPEEGAVAFVPRNALLEKLSPTKVEYHVAEDYQFETAGPAGFNWSEIILYALIGLLLLEQLLAYSSSYHPLKGATR